MTDQEPTAIVPATTDALAPRAEVPTVELEDTFADASLEMAGSGDKFRVASMLQDQIAIGANHPGTGGAAHALATTSYAGFMSAADKTQAETTKTTADAALANAATAQATANSALSATASLIASPPFISILKPPATPHAANDEFDSGDPDLIARGWTLVTDGGVVPTRVGPFDPTAAAMSANQYRSSIVGTKLLLQLASTVFISKPISASCALAARVSLFGIDIQAAGHGPWGVGVSSVARHTDGTNKFLFGWNQGNQLKLLNYNAGSYTNGGNVYTNEPRQAWDTMWYTCTIAGASLNAAESRYLSLHNGLVAISSGGSPATYTTFFAGLFLTAGPWWFEIDFIRRYPAGQFFPQ